MEKQRIRVYLGYASAWKYKHSRLESILDASEPEAESQIRECLAGLATVDGKLLTTAVNIAGIKKADETEFFGSSSVRSELHSVGKQLIGRISIILGVPIYSEYYGKTGYVGDSFSPGLGGRSGKGGPVPLG